MNRSIFLAPLAAAGLLASCAPEDRSAAVDPGPSEREAAMKTGREAAGVLKKALMTQLQAALEAGGPANAVDVCKISALPITESSGANFEGVSVRRTTLRTRNPENAPDDLDKKVLARFAGSRPDNNPGPVLEWNQTRLRYYEPLYIKELCLQCHGDPAAFSPDLRELLAASYPEDKATGYRAGDFRGLICVETPREGQGDDE